MQPDTKKERQISWKRQTSLLSRRQTVRQDSIFKHSAYSVSDTVSVTELCVDVRDVFEKDYCYCVSEWK